MFACHGSLQCHNCPLSCSVKFLASVSAFPLTFTREGDRKSLFHYQLQDIFKIHICLLRQNTFSITFCFTNAEADSGIYQHKCVTKCPDHLRSRAQWDFWMWMWILTSGLSSGEESSEQIPLSFPVQGGEAAPGAQMHLEGADTPERKAWNFLVPT